MGLEPTHAEAPNGLANRPLNHLGTLPLNWRRVRESNPQGFTLVRVQAGYRQPIGLTLLKKMAEAVGLEPTKRFRSTIFEIACRTNGRASNKKMDEGGLEPPESETPNLQSGPLPITGLLVLNLLCYFVWRKGQGSNLHRILLLARIPIECRRQPSACPSKTKKKALPALARRAFF